MVRRWLHGLLRALSMAVYDDGLPRGEVSRLLKHPDNKGKSLTISVSEESRKARHCWSVMWGKSYIVASGWGSTHTVALRMAEDAKAYLEA